MQEEVIIPLLITSSCLSAVVIPSWCFRPVQAFSSDPPGPGPAPLQALTQKVQGGASSLLNIYIYIHTGSNTHSNLDLLGNQTPL